MNAVQQNCEQDSLMGLSDNPATLTQPIGSEPINSQAGAALVKPAEGLSGITPEPSGSPNVVSRSELIRLFLEYLDEINDRSKEKGFREAFSAWISQVINQCPAITQKYLTLFLYADRILSRSDADSIYKALSHSSKTTRKRVLLVLHSPGGFSSSAYIIGKMLHEYSLGGVEIAVPRKAKSAATLLCCAASHIHMGSLSELGPIDPQLDEGPALGLKASIEHLARLSKEYPEATSLFVGYMAKRIDPISLGYCERAAESAMQYAIRLLRSAHSSCADEELEAIARKLTYDYKDHGFVIDKQEADALFPDGTVVYDSPEYLLSDALYQDLNLLERLARAKKYSFSFIGSANNYPMITCK